jgi:hypoxanthine phosphoribosyltransferase
MPERPGARLLQDMSVLLSEEQIQARVRELGQQITRDYEGAELTLVGVLKGSFLFIADLCRQIDLPLTCDFLGISSYGDRTTTSGVIRITSDLTQPVEGRSVLVVEDIVDTGLTMQYLLENLRIRGPKSVKVCSLLYKPSRARVPVIIDYVGFTIQDAFVVGYGLDFQGRYRNLPCLGVMNPNQTGVCHGGK